jgi:leader peptidase (prepilin peptidase)/N-methyltransferase
MIDTILWFFNEYQNWQSYLLIAFFGMIIGSFLNVVIYRIPQKINYDYYEFLKTEGYINENKVKQNNLLKNSSCPICNKKIKWYHNIPIFSYLYLKGECAYCHTKIRVQYIIVEIIATLTIVSAYSLFGLTPYFAYISSVVLLLVVIGCIDFNEELISDGLLVVLGFVFIYAGINNINHINIDYALINAFIIYTILMVFFYSYELVRKKSFLIGDGDIKLYAVLTLGLTDIDLAAYLISLSAIIALFTMLLLNLKKLPLGPSIVYSYFMMLIYMAL